MGTLVVSPHFDDAVLSAWALLERPGSQVVNVFTGCPPEGEVAHWERLTRARGTVAERIRERVLEDADALALAGIVPVNLGFVGSSYGDPSVLAQQVLNALAPLVAHADSVVFPAAIGGHPDHRFIRDVGRFLLQHGTKVRFYADCPYSIKYGWPSWVTGGERSTFLDEDVYLEAHLNDGGLSLGTLAPHVARLGGAALSRKLAATAAYRTQVDALNSGPLRRVSNPDVVCFEVVWTPS